MPSNHIKYTAVLAVLAVAAFFLPQIGERLNSVITTENTAAVVSSTDSKSETVFSNSPTLELVYSDEHKESQLTATFKVQVSGGASGTYVYGSRVPFVKFTNSSATSPELANKYSYAKIYPTATTKLDSSADVNGSVRYYIPAYKKADFVAVATVLTSQLLPGTYYATLDTCKIPLCTGTGNKTNAKTILGETSPFIASSTPQSITITQLVRLLGFNFKSTDTLYVDDVLVRVSNFTASKDGTSLSFTMPKLNSQLGYHYIAIQDPQTGRSNNYSIFVASDPSLFSLRAQVGNNPPGVMVYTAKDNLALSPSHAHSTGATISFSCAAGIKGTIGTSTADVCALGSSFAMDLSGKEGEYQTGVNFTNNSNSDKTVNATAHLLPGTTAEWYDRVQVSVPASN